MLVPIVQTLRHHLPMSIGVRIRQARLAAHITQDKLGQYLGVTKQLISHIETGRCQPSAKQIATICAICNTSADFLILGIPPSPMLPPRVLEVARRIAAMPEQQREILLTIFTGGADPDHVEAFGKKPRP